MTYAQSVGILRYVGRLGGEFRRSTTVSDYWTGLILPSPPFPAPPHAPLNPHPTTVTGLYPEQPLEAGLAVDQIVGGVEDMIVATVPFLFAGETEKVNAMSTALSGRRGCVWVYSYRRQLSWMPE